MKLSDESIHALADIVTGDKGKSPYQSGPSLVAFFNSLGFKDSYGQGFPTRWYYAKERLNDLHEAGDIDKAIRAILDPHRFLNEDFDQQTVCDYLNLCFELDGYTIVLENRFPQIREKTTSLTIKVTQHFAGIEEDRRAFINEQQAKIEQKLSSNDFDGAITNARSLVEAVLLSLEEELSDKEIKYDGDLLKLYKRVSRQMGLDPSRSDLETPLKQVLSGLTSVVSGIAGVSNKMGDRHARTYRPSKRHAQLVVDSAITVSNFLFETWKSKESDEAGN